MAGPLEQELPLLAEIMQGDSAERAAPEEPLGEGLTLHSECDLGAERVAPIL